MTGEDGDDFESDVTAADHGAARWSVDVEGGGVEPFRVVIDRPSIVGRERGCEVFVPSSDVEPRHLRLIPSLGGVVVQRVEGGGVFILREGMRAEQALALDGEVVQLGGVSLRLRLVDRDRTA